MSELLTADRVSGYETVERIQRSHRHARPNPAENPAWANCHMDCGILLNEIERLRDGIRGLQATCCGSSHPKCHGCKLLLSLLSPADTRGTEHG